MGEDEEAHNNMKASSSFSPSSTLSSSSSPSSRSVESIAAAASQFVDRIKGEVDDDNPDNESLQVEVVCSRNNSQVTMASPSSSISSPPMSLTSLTSNPSLNNKPFRSFKSSEEYLVAMKEDLSEWLSSMYGLEMNVDNFMSSLENGVILCRHANNVISKARDLKTAGHEVPDYFLSPTTKTSSSSSLSTVKCMTRGVSLGTPSWTPPKSVGQMPCNPVTKGVTTTGSLPHNRPSLIPTSKTMTITARNGIIPTSVRRSSLSANHNNNNDKDDDHDDDDKEDNDRTTEMMSRKFSLKTEITSSQSTKCKKSTSLNDIKSTPTSAINFNRSSISYNNNNHHHQVSYRVNACPGSFQARDNVCNFITWCRSLRIRECLLFETEDLVLGKNEKSFILCLLEVARRGSLLGMNIPMIVQLEQEIDQQIKMDEMAESLSKLSIKNNEVNADSQYNSEETSDSESSSDTTSLLQPQQQIITNDLRSLHEHVVDLLNRCTCPSQYPMIKVADGKYRIGDTKTLIFVRILRNHVMVRVGGGWDTLEHYLDKHDPCRCLRMMPAASATTFGGRRSSTNSLNSPSSILTSSSSSKNISEVSSFTIIRNRH